MKNKKLACAPKKTQTKMSTKEAYWDSEGGLYNTDNVTHWVSIDL